MDRETIITQRLKESLNPTELSIQNLSHRHQNHREVEGKSNNTHYTIKIVSEKFVDLSLPQRHRLVYKELRDLFEEGLHAVNIDAYTSNEV